MQKEQHYYSPEEYLVLEEAAEFRSEYYKGQILPMAGGTPNHNRIAVNLSFALNLAIPSFREYVLVDQHKIHVEHFAKTPDDKWLLSEYEDINVVLNLALIPFEISLANIYKTVTF